MSAGGEGLFGVLAEFTTADGVVAAARHMRNAGFRRIEAYSPYPVDALDELLGGRQVALPLVIFACGLLGFLIGFFLQWGGAAIDYPINVGGRPLNSWPAFGPTIFEFTVVWAVAGGFVAWFIANRLPRLSSPLREVPGFERATTDRFFLCVEAADPRFDRERLHWLFARCEAHRVLDVGA